MKKNAPPKDQSPSQLIDERIKELGDWRGAMLSRLRALIKEADPEVVEEWKWSVPVWSHAGLICTGETYKKAVKMTFAKGAALKDPWKLFNSSLEGNTRRAIDFHEGDAVDEKALKARPLLNIHDLAVLPSYRGRGVGHALLQAAEEHARREGCCKLTLEVRDDNARARALYRSFGFEDFAVGDDSTPTRFLGKPLSD